MNTSAQCETHDSSFTESAFVVGFIWTAFVVTQAGWKFGNIVGLFGLVVAAILFKALLIANDNGHLKPAAAGYFAILSLATIGVLTQSPSPNSWASYIVEERSRHYEDKYGAEAGPVFAKCAELREVSKIQECLIAARPSISDDAWNHGLKAMGIGARPGSKAGMQSSADLDKKLAACEKIDTKSVKELCIANAVK